MMMYVIPYDSEIQRLATKFDCGNSHLNAFLKSSRALDPGIGKTYMLLVDDASLIVGYYNIGVGYIEQQRDGIPQKMGGSVHINCFALDERFQKAPMDISDLPEDDEVYHISDFLLHDCINRIEMIRDKYVGFSFITLCSTQKGYSLYQRNGFDVLEADMRFAQDETEEKTYPMYFALDYEELESIE